MITIAGGVYRERCMRPNWDESYGSAGRAATAIARFGGNVDLHSFLDSNSLFIMNQRAALEGFKLVPSELAQGVTFEYVHGLSTPSIDVRSSISGLSLQITAEKVLRFGMIEGSAIVDANYVVYDPQSASNPEPFTANGSKAKHLALVLNRYEAQIFCGTPDLDPAAMAKDLAAKENAEVVVIKMGPLGALVYERGEVTTVPAYHTKRVWKIGSGDTFAAHFAYAWLEQGLKAHEAAAIASKATAFYCETQGYPTPKQLRTYSPEPLQASRRYQDGFRPLVYLAGPFFTLGQLWLIREALNDLQAMGLRVFSPYHDVGLGSADDVVEKDLEAIHECDLLFAIGDGLDSGTIYEIGYARALGKPVVLYAENESTQDKKMMEGSDCKLSDDYVSAIYQTVWEAIKL
ncbi:MULTISPECIES: PfkB family carbohydrate kinase [unclassified Pseudomonas]|uniref:PfkB family carbohydrate kinase n=1 Tax=unclassified Pseudomonas TaxID=196821 RepID=UPI000A1F0932|nr:MULTISPECIES: PfkB family carbohydrate kinase [unclassified Pseudomonas]